MVENNLMFTGKQLVIISFTTTHDLAKENDVSHDMLIPCDQDDMTPQQKIAMVSYSVPIESRKRP